LLILCFFLIFPLFAQEEEVVMDEAATEAAIPEETQTQDADAEESGAAEPEKKRNWFLRLFDDVRRPIIKTDNLIFGQPEFLNFDFGFDIGYDDVFWVGLGLKADYTAGPFSYQSHQGSYI